MNEADVEVTLDSNQVIMVVDMSKINTERIKTLLIYGLGVKKEQIEAANSVDDLIVRALDSQGSRPGIAVVLIGEKSYKMVAGRNSIFNSVLKNRVNACKVAENVSLKDLAKILCEHKLLKQSDYIELI